MTQRVVGPGSAGDAQPLPGGELRRERGNAGARGGRGESPCGKVLPAPWARGAAGEAFRGLAAASGAGTGTAAFGDSCRDAREGYPGSGCLQACITPRRQAAGNGVRPSQIPIVYIPLVSKHSAVVT